MLRCTHETHLTALADNSLPLSDLLTCYTLGYSKIAVTDAEHEDILCFWAQLGRIYVNITRTISFYNTESYVNLLKPIGYVMHQQFNIQQLYALPTLYLCVLYLSENKQRLVPLTA